MLLFCVVHSILSTPPVGNTSLRQKEDVGLRRGYLPCSDGRSLGVSVLRVWNKRSSQSFIRPAPLCHA